MARISHQSPRKEDNQDHSHAFDYIVHGCNFFEFSTVSNVPVPSTFLSTGSSIRLSFNYKSIASVPWEFNSREWFIAQCRCIRIEYSSDSMAVWWYTVSSLHHRPKFRARDEFPYDRAACSRHNSRKQNGNTT